MTEQATVDLEVKQGATFRQSFRWMARETELSELEPQSLAGYVARMQIRSRATSATAILTLTNDVTADDYNPSAYITLEPDAETGRLDVYIGATQTELIARNAVYDLELHLTGDEDEVVPFIGGAIILVREVTE